MNRIKKVLNSSVVLVEGENEQEFILFGKGIGYGQKAGNPIKEGQADQTFMPIENTQAKELLHLLDSIPQAYIDLTQEIVRYAEKQLGTKLNTGIYFTLMDHLHFAVERFKKQINITNRVFWEIKNFYQEEFEIGVYALDLVNKQLQVQLPKEEAANIAFHLINVQGEKQESKDGMQYAKMIGGVVNLVRYALQIQMDTDNIHYSRFITHVKFFVERFYAEAMLDEPENLLFEQIANLYPQAMDIAFKVENYISQVHGSLLPKEELAYLAVHIHRLASYQQLK
jgi:beta-glucoside operon transcriptional antiterminator